MFKLIENLDNFFILSEEKEDAIIGTYVTLRITRTNNKHPFSPHLQPKDKEIPVFFLVSCTKKGSKRLDNFTKNKLPVLYLSNNQEIPKTAEDFRIKFNEFVEKTF